MRRIARAARLPRASDASAPPPRSRTRGRRADRCASAAHRGLSHGTARRAGCRAGSRARADRRACRAWRACPARPGRSTPVAASRGRRRGA